MRWKTFWILAIVMTAYVAVPLAEDKGVWVGTRFNPKQCLEIAEGTFDVKHKLCTIRYQIQPRNGHFKVDASLRFNERFIPDKVSDVELEILLIDDKRVCTQQLNQRKQVNQKETHFSFVTEKRPSQRYVRTYYIIHYR